MWRKMNNNFPSLSITAHCEGRSEGGRRHYMHTKWVVRCSKQTCPRRAWRLPMFLSKEAQANPKVSQICELLILNMNCLYQGFSNLQMSIIKPQRRRVTCRTQIARGRARGEQVSYVISRTRNLPERLASSIQLPRTNPSDPDTDLSMVLSYVDNAHFRDWFVNKANFEESSRVFISNCA